MLQNIFFNLEHQTGNVLLVIDEFVKASSNDDCLAINFASLEKVLIQENCFVVYCI